jgi:aldehyde dehydrogenase
VVIKSAEQTPWSLLKVIELFADLLPAGVVNVVNSFGVEAGQPLASSSRIAKIAFTGETTTGRLIMQYASQNLIPVDLELGGKSPDIFFEDAAAANDDFYDKALDRGLMFAPKQGEVCTCPSRALVQQSTYEQFVPDAIAGIQAVNPGIPSTLTRRMWRSARPRGPRCSPAASGPASAASCPAATTRGRRYSRAAAACASSRRRSSGRSSR